LIDQIAQLLVARRPLHPESVRRLLARREIERRVRLPPGATRLRARDLRGMHVHRAAATAPAAAGVLELRARPHRDEEKRRRARRSNVVEERPGARDELMLEEPALEDVGGRGARRALHGDRDAEIAHVDRLTSGFEIDGPVEHVAIGRVRLDDLERAGRRRVAHGARVRAHRRPGASRVVRPVVAFADAIAQGQPKRRGRRALAAAPASSARRRGHRQRRAKRISRVGQTGDAAVVVGECEITLRDRAAYRRRGRLRTRGRRALPPGHARGNHEDGESHRRTDREQASSHACGTVSNRVPNPPIRITIENPRARRRSQMDGHLIRSPADTFASCSYGSLIGSRHARVGHIIRKYRVRVRGEGARLSRASPVQ
jgi:hypothetical protein